MEFKYRKEVALVVWRQRHFYGLPLIEAIFRCLCILLTNPTDVPDSELYQWENLGQFNHTPYRQWEYPSGNQWETVVMDGVRWNTYIDSNV